MPEISRTLSASEADSSLSEWVQGTHLRPNRRPRHHRVFDLEAHPCVGRASESTTICPFIYKSSAIPANTLKWCQILTNEGTIMYSPTSQLPCKHTPVILAHCATILRIADKIFAHIIKVCSNEIPG